MELAFRYFEEVARHGSIRKAAAQLHVSASSISRQIAKLEHEFDTTLLLRHAGGIRLTPSGQAMERFLHSRSREIQRLQASIHALTHLEKGHVTIYTVEGTIGGLLSDALERFSSDYPGIEYEVFTAGTDDVMRAVAEDRCDIGLSYYPQPRSDVQIIRTIRQPLMVAVSPRHRLAGRTAVEPADLEGEMIAIPDRSFGIRHLVDHLVKASNVKLTVRMETNSIHMVRHFAIRGMGVAFLPQFTIEPENKAGDLVGIPLTHPGLPEASLKICRRREMELFTAAARLVDYLIDAAGGR